MVSVPLKLRLKIAPVDKSTSAASARENVGLVMLKVPACTAVLPVYVLAPVSVSVPAPTFETLEIEASDFWFVAVNQLQRDAHQSDWAGAGHFAVAAAGALVPNRYCHDRASESNDYGFRGA
jgi:hypothetical protein